MMTSYRYINSLILLCFVLLAGCSDDWAPYHSPNEDDTKPNVTLTLNIGIADSGDGNGTRTNNFDTVPANNNYELINTLRVIIVREDNTVECNQKINLAPGVAVRNFSELEFQVSTTEGKTEGLLRTEKKRIYLIANEASIQPNPNGIDVVKYLSGLKEGHYENVKDPAPEAGQTEGSEESDKVVYKKGDTFTPENAASLIIYNNWPNGSNGASPDVAVPYVDNEGASKKYIPMTEFFDIEVTENLKTGLNNKKQVEDLFITRNLVKFRFSIDAAPGTTPFKVTAITFNRLMQEEYLFLHGKYSPLKEEGDINTKRQITEFDIPGYEGKNICPYIFRPMNFGFKGTSEDFGYEPAYMPSLYFCETKTLILTTEEDSKPDFSVGIDVEYPFTEEVVDKDGNASTQPVTNHFEAKTLGNLPFFLPRNTIVDVKMTLGNGELSAVATVYPYTAVNLNPEFGFNIPVNKVIISERSKEGDLKPIEAIELREGESIDLIGTVEPANANNQDLVWTSGDPKVVSVSEIGRVTAIALPEGKSEYTVSITAMAADGSGAKATCEVTVKQKIPVESITVSPTTWSGNIGSTTSLTATISPETATVQDVKWESSDPAVASVSSYGVVTAVGPGDATITAVATDGAGKSATCSVHVNEKIPVTSVTLSAGPSGTFYAGEQFSFNATVEPSNATNQGVKWTSSPESIATVTNYGLVTALKEGDVTIKATAVDGSDVYGSLTFHVTNPEITLTKSGQPLTEEWKKMSLDSKRDVRATITPANVFKGIVWTSSDESVAIVDVEELSYLNTNNSSVVYVIAKGKGTAVITATSSINPEVFATVTVTVE